MPITSLAIIVAVAAGLTEVMKSALNLPSRFAPLTSVILGIVAAALFTGSFTLIATYTTGVIAGLTACGLYSGIKTTANTSNSDVQAAQAGTASV